MNRLEPVPQKGGEWFFQPTLGFAQFFHITRPQDHVRGHRDNLTSQYGLKTCQQANTWQIRSLTNIIHTGSWQRRRVYSNVLNNKDQWMFLNQSLNRNIVFHAIHKNNYLMLHTLVVSSYTKRHGMADNPDLVPCDVPLKTGVPWTAPLLLGSTTPQA